LLYAGIVERDGLIGLYRGFVANTLKNLPNSRYPFVHRDGTVSFNYGKMESCWYVYQHMEILSFTALLCPCSIKLTAFDTVKTLISTGQKELEKIIQENQENMS
jgi:solute carrier family 25 (mitochondrial phosphate transporter), member 23/24/25/41